MLYEAVALNKKYPYIHTFYVMRWIVSDRVVPVPWRRCYTLMVGIEEKKLPVRDIIAIV